MLISFLSSPGCEGSREGVCGWSHWLIWWVFPPSTLWPAVKGGWVRTLVNPAWAGGLRPTGHSDKVSGLWGINLISEGFYLPPKWGDHRVDVAEGGAFWRSLEQPWSVLEFLPPRFLVVSVLNVRGPLGSNFPRKKFVGSTWGNASISLSL